MAAAAVVRRNRPGTTREAFNNWPDQPLADMDTTLAVQQFIQQGVRAHYAKLAELLAKKASFASTEAYDEAVDREIELLLALPELQDADVWQYEHLRQFCLELNALVLLIQDTCTPGSCPQMKATDDLLYLCAAHKQPLECSAIDYIVHTLDSIAAQLNSNKFFPSRVTIQKTSVKHFQAIARRLYRIFAHTYFHHRQVYDKFEEQTQLTSRFVKFAKQYDLVPESSMVISHPSDGSSS
ncbi:preimplantation protein 3 [Capsaspora owczarzaki ATCC 30864]|nr:preimplantation protein 3 [Capsaspora owczarzaki ATCC 30864]|eukprot:XP_004342599.1 preimplantation protein 3 [Capsaspora owczarzaki ATCC 30864]